MPSRQKIEFPGSNGTALAGLLEIADKCPVHKTLTGQLEIRTNQLPAI